jgi:hypothetical protein
MTNENQTTQEYLAQLTQELNNLESDLHQYESKIKEAALAFSHTKSKLHEVVAREMVGKKAPEVEFNEVQTVTIKATSKDIEEETKKIMKI